MTRRAIETTPGIFTQAAALRQPCPNGIDGGSETLAHLLGLPTGEAPWSPDIPEYEPPGEWSDWFIILTSTH